MNISLEPLTIRSVVTRYYSSWSACRRVRPDVTRAAWCIMRCRSAELGAHVSRCDCGHITHVQYNSCRHRSCPQCRGGRRADWLQRTNDELLPCDHVHIIFTVPEQLNTLWQFNRAGFAERLLKAARQTLETLLADPKYLGAKPGIISALHTWGRNPHGVSVADYLARYMSGGPISDKRLCSISDEAVTFRFTDHRDGSAQLMKLTPHDFLSRWFEHVPPRGLRMIRRSGFYANSSGDVRKQICEHLAAERRSTQTGRPAASAGVTPLDREQCPVCNTCVTVRFVSRVILGTESPDARLLALSVCPTRPS